MESESWLDTNAHKLLNVLGIRISKEKEYEIWCYSPFRNERTASFKLKKDGLLWFDHGMNEGGGPLKLIAKLNNIEIDEACRIALDNGLMSTLVTKSGNKKYLHKTNTTQKQEVKEKKFI